jgi:CheY-like chemotaxis protein
VDDPSRGFALGAADLATKPVDRARLSQILKKYTCPHPPCPVLLVEDDPATREVTRIILEKEGWKVSEAENGRVALQCMEQSRPRLIMLDLMMPEMDGFEFVARLRQKVEWRSIPIVVLTAYDHNAEERRRLSGYVETIIKKGSDTREVVVAPITQLPGRLHSAAAMTETALTFTKTTKWVGRKAPQSASRDWNTFLFLGMMGISALAEAAGLFDWLAVQAARLAGRNAARLFLNVFLLGDAHFDGQGNLCAVSWLLTRFLGNVVNARMVEV